MSGMPSFSAEGQRFSLEELKEVQAQILSDHEVVEQVPSFS